MGCGPGSPARAQPNIDERDDHGGIRSPAAEFEDDPHSDTHPQSQRSSDRALSGDGRRRRPRETRAATVDAETSEGAEAVDENEVSANELEEMRANEQRAEAAAKRKADDRALRRAIKGEAVLMKEAARMIKRGESFFEANLKNEVAQMESLESKLKQNMKLEQQLEFDPAKFKLANQRRRAAELEAKNKAEQQESRARLDDWSPPQSKANIFIPGEDDFEIHEPPMRERRLPTQDRDSPVMRRPAPIRTGSMLATAEAAKQDAHSPSVVSHHQSVPGLDGDDPLIDSQDEAMMDAILAGADF